MMKLSEELHRWSFSSEKGLPPLVIHLKHWEEDAAALEAEVARFQETVAAYEGLKEALDHGPYRSWQERCEVAESEVARLQGLVDAEPAPPAEARRRCDCPVPWEVADGGFGRGGQASWLYARGIRAIICECGVTVSLDAPPAPDAATLADWAEWRRLDAMVSYWKEKRDCPHIGDSHFQLREGNRQAFQEERDRHQRPPDAAPATDATGGEGTCPE